MTIINPGNDLIAQTIRLYSTLMQAAETLHQLGPESGVKRTIILHLLYNGETSARKMAAAYPMPAGAGERVVKDLALAGAISLKPVSGDFVFALTDAGRELADRIVRTEAAVFQRSSVAMPLARLRETAAVLAAMTDVISQGVNAKPVADTSTEDVQLAGVAGRRRISGQR
jgi:hypothetical protein